jgi:hypothetical protein
MTKLTHEQKTRADAALSRGDISQAHYDSIVAAGVEEPSPEMGRRAEAVAAYERIQQREKDGRLARAWLTEHGLITTEDAETLTDDEAIKLAFTDGPPAVTKVRTPHGAILVEGDPEAALQENIDRINRLTQEGA